jgi:hypothetical protein
MANECRPRVERPLDRSHDPAAGADDRADDFRLVQRVFSHKRRVKTTAKQSSRDVDPPRRSAEYGAWPSVVFPTEALCPTG